MKNWELSPAFIRNLRKKIPRRFLSHKCIHSKTDSNFRASHSLYDILLSRNKGIEDVNEPRHGRGKECAAGDKARIKNNKVRGGDRGTGAGGPCAVRRSVNRARRGSNKSRPRLEPAAADIFSLEHLGSKLSFPSYLFSQAEAVSLSGPR